MKILFYYYSGTGNTEYLARKMQEEFNKINVETVLCDVTDLSKKYWEEYNADDFDVIGFGYPIHAFSAPKNFVTFVKLLKIRNKEFFILKNSREALRVNDSSSRKIVKALKRKSCNLILEKHLLLPYNIHFRNDDGLVKQMLVCIKEKLPVFVKEIAEKRYKKIHFHLIPSICEAVVGGIEKKGAKLIGKSFCVKENCISCMKCVRDCPNGNITVKEETGRKIPVFGNKCMICMRCVMNCPTESIVIGKYLKGWEVYGKYDFDKILSDENIQRDYITEEYNGRFKRSYKRYFLK